MKNESQVPVGGQQLLPQNDSTVDAEGVSDVSASLPRRQFLKRSGAATAGTILAWHGSRVDVYAEESTEKYWYIKANGINDPKLEDAVEYRTEVVPGKNFVFEVDEKDTPDGRWIRETWISGTVGDWTKGYAYNELEVYVNAYFQLKNGNDEWVLPLDYQGVTQEMIKDWVQDRVDEKVWPDSFERTIILGAEKLPESVDYLEMEENGKPMVKENWEPEGNGDFVIDFNQDLFEPHRKLQVVVDGNPNPGGGTMATEQVQVTFLFDNKYE